MYKKIIFGTTLLIGFLFSANQTCFAQGKTQEELKTKQDSLKIEMNSKTATERQAKFEKLKQPKASGVSSVDGLATNATRMLTSSKKINKTVAEMYEGTTGETKDGKKSTVAKKPTLDELESLSTDISKQIKAVKSASNDVTTASADIKKASPMQAPKATKSLNYSKKVIGLVAPELKLNLKIVNYLIDVTKSSKK